jgi:hypothetical protein
LAKAGTRQIWLIVASRFKQAATKRTAHSEWAGQEPAKNEKGGWWAATDGTHKCRKVQYTTLDFFVKG